MQRKQPLPEDEVNAPIVEVKGKDGPKRKYAVNIDVMQDPLLLIERNNFIVKYF